MRVAVIQQKNHSDLQANLDHSLALVREAADKGAELVLLQELHRSLYFCQTEDTTVFDPVSYTHLTLPTICSV